jgi:hypothetical protein
VVYKRLTSPFIVFFVSGCIVYVLTVVVSFIVVFLLCVMCVNCLLYCCTTATRLKPNCSLTNIYIYRVSLDIPADDLKGQLSCFTGHSSSKSRETIIMFHQKMKYIFVKRSP